MILCRKCGRKPAVTSDGFCFSCKKKEILMSKLVKFGQRQRWVNKYMSGGIVDG